MACMLFLKWARNSGSLLQNVIQLFFVSYNMHTVKTFGAERAPLGYGVSEFPLLIYILKKKLLGEFPEMFLLEHCIIIKIIQ